MNSLARSLLLLGTLGVVGCNAASDIDQAVDCSDVCNRYRTCYDTSYDVDACRARCDQVVDGDGGRSYAANECDTCMDDRSCTAAVFACSAPCAGILP